MKKKKCCVNLVESRGFRNSLYKQRFCIYNISRGESRGFEPFTLIRLDESAVEGRFINTPQIRR